jgi:hypothetical protein
LALNTLVSKIQELATGELITISVTIVYSIVRLRSDVDLRQAESDQAFESVGYCEPIGAKLPRDDMH